MPGIKFFDVLKSLTALRIEWILGLNWMMSLCHGQFHHLKNAILAEPRVDCGLESITVSCIKLGQ